MQIYVDADACPVQKEIFSVAEKYKLHVTLVKSISHFSHEALPAFVEAVYVDKGAEKADFKIIQLISSGDILITQDYGLASICLGKGAIVMHHKGFQYTQDNIEEMLAIRHQNALARRSGIRTKGPKAFTNENRTTFKSRFDHLISRFC